MTTPSELMPVVERVEARIAELRRMGYLTSGVLSYTDIFTLINAARSTIGDDAGWQHLVDQLSDRHPGEECTGPSCRICKALVGLTYALDERDRSLLEKKDVSALKGQQ